MEVYDVEFWEFWDKNDCGLKNNLKVCGEDVEQAIKKVKKLVFEKEHSEWTETPDKDNKLKKPVVHKLDSIEIHQVLHVASLDG